MAEESEITELYRHFGSDGGLLYVGISLSTVARLAQHRDGSDWYRQIARVEIQHYQTRSDARAAEDRAILTEKPKYNRTRPAATDGGLANALADLAPAAERALESLATGDAPADIKLKASAMLADLQRLRTGPKYVPIDTSALRLNNAVAMVSRASDAQKATLRKEVSEVQKSCICHGAFSPVCEAAMMCMGPMTVAAHETALRVLRAVT